MQADTNRETVAISDVLGRVALAGPDNGATALIRQAYDVAERAHAGQDRKSGDPYIQHPLSVALLLADVGMGADTIAAGLLHDVVEDTGISLDQLAETFNDDIAALVDGVTKLEQMEKEQVDDRFSGADKRRSVDEEAESLRKMFIAMAEDIRVVIIKLADRLHNMRTLAPLEKERQKAFARETQEIFAPLASSLGIWQWKWELEDLSLRYLDPEIYRSMKKLIAERRPDREASVKKYIGLLREKLEDEELEAKIDGRPKHIYSIYRKMRRKDVPFEQVYDIRGIRVIAQSEPDCYRILGIVHNLWVPIPGEFDDYIATPKDNGYQSLHTAVITGKGGTLEVQIRTTEMDRIAEYGVAAHWRYKESGKPDPSFDTKIAWMRSLVEWQRELTDASEFVDAMKTDIFQDRVYAFTPAGDIIDLPAGSTPIDFAYHIHTEVGHRCRGAKVNDRWVGLDTQLKTGDRVKIITDKQASPSRDWINPALGYVKTGRARAKIRRWFRRQDREKNILEGRELVERELKHLGMERLGHDRVAELFGYDKVSDFHAAVGFGDINSQQIASKVAELSAEEERELLPFEPPSLPQTVEGIQVQGTGGLMTRLAQCCSPLPGEDIVGYVTRGRGVTIHRRDCHNVLRANDRDRLIEVSWGAEAQTVPVAIHIKAYDRTGLLHEITGVISKEKVNMSAVNVGRQRNIATLYITLEIGDIAQLSRILTKVESLPNVIEAKRHIG
ncbi:MAG: bifunctional (p)ppGpp synthetase/guanosine-3',5'-bis(diphosphate) 3'-pyrophosphohydrolase [Anaerolineae bacterium]|jgi:GTP pyrophosphokinase